MKKHNILGFTLVELLAVIVVLAIILAIAVPNIANVIKNASKNAFRSDAEMVLRQLEYYKLNSTDFDITGVNENNMADYNLSNINYDSVNIGIVHDNPYIIIDGKNKWEGLKACGIRGDMIVVPITDSVTCQDFTIYDASKGVNKPKLADGMIPIKWNGAAWIDTTASDPDWYSYTTTDKKWANARTADGSMWVWIPRFIYRISSGWHTNTDGTIDVQFSIAMDDTRDGTVPIVNTGSASDSNGTWTNHPAFTFGSTELSGIWVAKFEASGTTANIDIKPNVVSLRTVSVDEAFNSSLSMETNTKYGWDNQGNDIDTHLIKNIEWGAVTYLAESSYGKNTTITYNTSSAFYTGGGIDDAFVVNVGQSTTGNVYGIYDMAGGSTEFVSAYVNNGNSNLTSSGPSIINADTKYKDIYNASTDDQAVIYDDTANRKGDAMYETSSSYSARSSWYDDYVYMPYYSYVWFARGENYSDSTPIGGPFAFTGGLGSGDGYASFRPVLAVGSGL